MRLYHGGGAGDFELLQERFSEERWLQIKKLACRLLQSRKLELASEMLNKIPFDFYDAVNWFGDEFCVLSASLPIEEYIELSETQSSITHAKAFQDIAKVVTEIGGYVRFITVSPCTESANLDPVKNPDLCQTSNIVERALLDAEKLIQTRDAISGVDRVHTAFHGYLRILLKNAGLDVEKDASTTQLFKILREKHPAFCEAVTRDEDINKIIRSMAVILDAVNPIRNRASVAHANEELLEEPETMLVINAIRTLLHYINAKVSK